MGKNQNWKSLILAVIAGVVSGAVASWVFIVSITFKTVGFDIYLAAQIIIAIGTVLVAILALWGDKVRSFLFGPGLEFELHDVRGDLAIRQNGRRRISYHVKILNRKSAPAKRVRIICSAIFKKAPDGSFLQEPLSIPLQLTWGYPDFHEVFPTIVRDDVCDLGFLDEDDQCFRLSSYVVPNNFKGFITVNETMRIHLLASADNFVSRSPYPLEISWDGNWSSDLEEMGKHLVIKEVREK